MICNDKLFVVGPWPWWSAFEILQFAWSRVRPRRQTLIFFCCIMLSLCPLKLDQAIDRPFGCCLLLIGGLLLLPKSTGGSIDRPNSFFCRDLLHLFFLSLASKRPALIACLHQRSQKLLNYRFQGTIPVWAVQLPSDTRLPGKELYKPAWKAPRPFGLDAPHAICKTDTHKVTMMGGVISTPWEL